MNEVVCIVGKHDKTRTKAPWDDLTQDIWLFNDTMHSVDREGKFWARRCNAIIDMHRLERYRESHFVAHKNHWLWLQHPRPYPIYMHHAYPEIPSSVRYPLPEIQAALKPKRMFSSGPAYALALAIYLGYRKIRLFGIEMETDTEYQDQLQGIIYWVGYAQGRGIEVDTISGKWAFERLPLYGIEKDHTHSWSEFQSKLDRLRLETGWILAPGKWIDNEPKSSSLRKPS